MLRRLIRYTRQNPFGRFGQSHFHVQFFIIHIQMVLGRISFNLEKCKIESESVETDIWKIRPRNKLERMIDACDRDPRQQVQPTTMLRTFKTYCCWFLLSLLVLTYCYSVLEFQMFNAAFQSTHSHELATEVRDISKPPLLPRQMHSNTNYGPRTSSGGIY